MGEEEQPAIEMDCSLSFSLTNEKGKETNSGEGKGQIDAEHLAILPQSGDAIHVSLRDIVGIEEADYRLNLFLTSNEQLALFDLGRCYEDFYRALCKLRNEIIMKDMLMNETLKKPVAEAEFTYSDEDGNKESEGNCEARLYETGLVIMPEKGQLVRIPYSDISSTKDEEYSLTFTTEYGAKLTLMRMGRTTDPFKRTLADLNNKLSAKSQAVLKELSPKTDPATIAKAAKIMREGRAARRSDIEAVSPTLWKDLEKKLALAGLKEKYDYLSSLGQQSKICIGIKRGLMGDLTGDYLWFIIPVYSTNSKDPGNAIILEAGVAPGKGAVEKKESGKEEETTEEGAAQQEAETEEEGEGEEAEAAGKATYIFRIVGRQDYPNFKKLDDLQKQVDDFITKTNRALLSVNFRREPIYLPDEKLDEPRYQKYQFSIQLIPGLQMLRSQFIGRVIHSSPDQWKSDVASILKFNTSTRDDNARWNKAK